MRWFRVPLALHAVPADDSTAASTRQLGCGGVEDQPGGPRRKGLLRSPDGLGRVQVPLTQVAAWRVRRLHVRVESLPGCAGGGGV
jgi:hypothetical protein